MFISFLYMFRATTCPSSGEKLYLCDIWYLLFCADDCLVCRVHLHPTYQTVIHTVPSTFGNCHSVWMTACYAGYSCTLHTKQSSIQYQVSHRYSYFSWW